MEKAAHLCFCVEIIIAESAQYAILANELQTVIIPLVMIHLLIPIAVLVVFVLNSSYTMCLRALLLQDSWGTNVLPFSPLQQCLCTLCNVCCQSILESRFLKVRALSLCASR